MRRFASVVGVVAWRAIHHFLTNPAFLIPSLLFPTFFLVAFAGGLSSVADVPGFDYPAGYTAFQFAFVLLQASAFGGVFTGFAIATDFESGFSRRLLLAAPNRTAILIGYALAGLARTLWTGLFIFGLAIAAGMDVLGGPGDLAGLVLLSLAMSVVAMLFSAGIALRMRTIQAGPLMQMPLFIVLFLAPVYVPEHLLAGWIRDAAAINPFTPVVVAARSLLAGLDVEVLTVTGIMGAGAVLMAAFALRGLRRAEAEAG